MASTNMYRKKVRKDCVTPYGIRFITYTAQNHNAGKFCYSLTKHFFPDGNKRIDRFYLTKYPILHDIHTLIKGIGPYSPTIL